MTKNSSHGGKKMTIDTLALIMGRSFEHLEKRFDKFEQDTNQRFEKIDARFDRIENILLRDNQQRIERLEDKMAQVQVTLGKNF